MTYMQGESRVPGQGEAFVALGGNIGDTDALFFKALEKIADLEGVSGLQVSKYYRTKPVSVIPQRDYLNGVCRFLYPYSPEQLLLELQRIEREMGKIPKPKDAPRPIDLDLLFHGQATRNTPELALPHPHWRMRIFVLEPLADLTDRITLRNEVWDLNVLIGEQR